MAVHFVLTALLFLLSLFSSHIYCIPNLLYSYTLRVARHIPTALRLGSAAPKKCQSGGDTVPDLTGPAIEPSTCRANFKPNSAAPTGVTSNLPYLLQCI